MARFHKFFVVGLLVGTAVSIIACRQQDGPAPTVAPTAVLDEAAVDVVAATPMADATVTSAPTATPTVTASPTPILPKELVVCLPQEPADLYLYGDDSLAATAVRHALYESMITSLGYDYQAHGIVKLPNLADGDAVINTVEVTAGDRIVNASGDPVRLAPGVQLVTADGEFLTYSDEASEPVLMQQMVVDFEMQPLVWSDGTPVTAVDSVFSFNVAADPLTPADRVKVNRTASYEATGERSLRWTGLPGFLDGDYFRNVWMPLPSHQLAELTPEQLLTAPQTSEAPLGHGPFVVTEWVRGERMTLAQNPHYYRLPERLSAVNQLTLLFVEDGLAAVRDGRCHIATQGSVTFLQAADILAAAESGEVTPHFQSSLIFEHIDFGINPEESYTRTRPDWFEDVRVRQAMTLCTDRQRMIDDLMFGQTNIMHAYIPDVHPLYPEDAFTQPYDPAAANALLDDAGFIDTDENGIREFVERESGEIVSTTPFSVTLGTDSDSQLRQQINEMFAEDMQQCGIHVDLYEVPVIDWYADGPFSPLFGRRFDLATFAWLTNIRPPCNLYLSRNITGAEEEGFGGWNNVNATGWSDEAYDAACEAALAALPGTPAYAAQHQEAVRIFSEQLPMIPLFPQVKVAVTAPEVIGFRLDATQPSELWNLFEIDFEETR